MSLFYEGFSVSFMTQAWFINAGTFISRRWHMLRFVQKKCVS